MEKTFFHRFWLIEVTLFLVVQRIIFILWTEQALPPPAASAPRALQPSSPLVARGHHPCTPATEATRSPPLLEIDALKAMKKHSHAS
jgi:hypothetical protein